MSYPDSIETPSRLGALLADQKADAPRPYTPQFTVTDEDGGWRLFDGDRAIAKFMPTAADIWAFSPFSDDEKFHENPPEKVVDLHTVHNTFINLGVQGWPKHWLEGGRAADELVNWAWQQREGAELRATIKVDAPEGEFGEWQLRIYYDADWGKYRYTWDIHVRKMDYDGMEAFNLMTAGALGSRPGERRWTHSLWDGPAGQLRRIVHSNALFFATDFGGNRDGGGPWRWRHTTSPWAWVGYGADPTFNPVVLITDSSTPLNLGTCSQLFDEHIRWGLGGQDNIEEDGYYHYRMSTELVNASYDLMSGLLERAADPVKPKKWHFEQPCVAFHMDVVNNFDELIDVWQPEDAPILGLSHDRNAAIHWADEHARSGSHSICLQSTQANKRVTLFPAGAVCLVTPHTDYRLSGWVRTEDVAWFARLELFSYAYGYGNIFETQYSERVTGSSDWTEVTVELNSGDAAYLMPQFVLYDRGRAWFDDVQLVKV